MARYRIGCDVGGTFTDTIAINVDTGERVIAKSLSTPPSFTDGIMNSLKKLGISGAEVEDFRHGSTAATNAVLERKGAQLGLIVTKGFKGLYPGERSERMGSFELNWDPPEPLVAPRNILAVEERISTKGEEVTPLNEEDVRRAARIFKKRGMEAIAVCYMDSYANPAHEIRTKEILEEECPDMFISISYEVLPRMLAFERASTTILNAYVGPVLVSYMNELSKRLREWGYKGEILITHSGGGVMTVDNAVKLPVATCHSSPVSGVVGFAGYIGGLAGYSNVIAFETGGTTNDVSMIFKGNPTSTQEWRILWNTPCCLPSIETVYIGAGGGSIAWIDTGGALQVGPQSAGARPGPACFGFGGTEPTVTDCQLVLGRLNPKYFLGGDIEIYPDLARKAIKEKIADKCGWSVEEAADAVLKVCICNLMIALRLQSVSRGWDPKDFAIVAYGGGGGLYAVALAAELGNAHVIMPPLPGYGSALGTLRLPMKHELTTPIQRTERELDFSELSQKMDELVKTGEQILKEAGLPGSAITVQRFADMKYFDQFRSLTVSVPPGKIKDLSGLKEKFHEAMLKEYGYDIPPGLAEVEVANLRVAAVGKMPVYELKKEAGSKEGAEKGLKEKRKVYFDELGGFVETAIYERANLPIGAVFSGPAIIEQPDTTTVVPQGATCLVDNYRNLIITLK